MTTAPPSQNNRLLLKDSWEVMSAICAEREMFPQGASFVCWAVRNTLRAAILGTPSAVALRRLADVVGVPAVREVLAELRDEETVELLARLDTGAAQLRGRDLQNARLLSLAGVLERAGGEDAAAGAPQIRTLRKHGFLGARRGAARS